MAYYVYGVGAGVVIQLASMEIISEHCIRCVYVSLNGNWSNRMQPVGDFLEAKHHTYWLWVTLVCAPQYLGNIFHLLCLKNMQVEIVPHSALYFSTGKQTWV